MLNITSHQRNATQTTVIHHLTPTMVAIIKKTGNRKGCWDVQKLDYCYNAGSQCEAGHPLQKSVQLCLARVHTEPPDAPAISTPRNVPGRKKNIRPHKHPQVNAYGSTEKNSNVCSLLNG